ncbi:MAG TPA: glycoside hydrolase family 2 TIM barrel-domain containing protein [Bryobacteraceae bacterium]|nr:glycoside hydrolase family 2 TIM barrel-domain containing protein [Bryobacteraceae bacterium]
MRFLPSRAVAFGAVLFAAVAMTAAPVPRPEFPNPIFERADWLSLNGAWSFAFDDSDAGLAAKWYSHPLAHQRRITVPYCFESKLSGIAETSFHPVAWYQRSLQIPSGWHGKNVLLHFGAVYYQASVWLNGQLLGAHEGGNVPFSFDITSALHSGANVLTVRTYNPPTDKSIARGKQYWKPKSASIFYTRTSGIWQPVWLESVGANHLASVHITAGQDGIVHVEGFLAHHPAEPLTFEMTVLDGSQSVATAATQSVEDRVAAILPVPNAKLWSPDSPHLYQVRYRLLRAGEPLDSVQSYLGFRTVGVANDRVTINGKPVYLKFLLDQGYWPESILTPPSDEAIERDISLAQSLGFNGVRKHQKVADPRFLYYADRRGLLVSGEIADAQEFTSEEVERFDREWAEAVRRDYNHPSIIIWNAINESWGVPDLKDPRQQAFLKDTYQLTHTLDSTRLVIDNEGWQHTDETDLFAIHDYEKSGEKLFEKYKDVTPQSTSIPKNGRIALLPGYRYNGSPLYLSEFGGIAFIPPGAKVPGESWGYSGVEKTEEAALARLTQLYEGLAKLHNLAGVCYTQITDVEQEVNGLATYDRKLKYPAGKVKILNDQLH